jgi:3-hydroxyacyl-[acyl-carrier-protein] dehydratase
MPTEIMLDLSKIDLDHVEMDINAIRAVNRQRDEMEQLSRVIYIDREAKIILGAKDVTDGDFWVRGHIPGRPLMPGVIMIECSAQLSSLGFKLLSDADDDRFIGFGGVTDVKFRGMVAPPAVFYVIARAREMRRRRAIFDTQVVVDGKLVYEGTIIGMPI